MSFEFPIRLMREGIGNINYMEPPGAASGFINVAGARNGLTVDSSNYIVLGQSVGASGNPAILLNNREVPGGGFQLNLFNGNLILSDASQAGAGGRLEIYNAVTGAASTRSLFISPTFNTTGAPQALAINITNTSSNALSAALRITSSNKAVFTVQAAGSVLLADPPTGTQYAAFEPSVYSNIPLKHANANNNALQINAAWNPSVANNGNANDILISSVVNLSNAAAIEYTSLLITPTLTQGGTSTGFIRGIYYNPTLGTPFQSIALETAVGDVHLCSDRTSANRGRVSISTGLPTAGITIGALLAIGAGGTDVLTAPLKFGTDGSVLTIAEPGAMEYDGVNLFFSRINANPSTRETVFCGNDGAAAPVTSAGPVFTHFYGGNTNQLGDPSSWASVVINAVTYKIPLYL